MLLCVLKELISRFEDHCELGSSLGLLQLLLGLSELGQVEGGDLLGLLDLLLVGLELHLELAGQLGLLVGLHGLPTAGLKT